MTLLLCILLLVLLLLLLLFLETAKAKKVEHTQHGSSAHVYISSIENEKYNNSKQRTHKYPWKEKASGRKRDREQGSERRLMDSIERALEIYRTIAFLEIHHH